MKTVRFLSFVIFVACTVMLLTIGADAAIGLKADGYFIGLDAQKTYTAYAYDFATDTVATTGTTVDANTNVNTALGAGVWKVTDGTESKYIFVNGTTSGQLTVSTISSTVGAVAGSWSRYGIALGPNLAIATSGSNTGIKITVAKAKFNNGDVFKAGITYGFTNEQVIPAAALTKWEITDVDLDLNGFADGKTAADLKGAVIFHVKTPESSTVTEYETTFSGVATGAITANAPAAMAESDGYVVAVSVVPWKGSDGVLASLTGNTTAFVYLANGNKLDYDATKIDYATAVTGVELNKTTLTLTKGNTETLVATVLPDTAVDKTCSWSTTNSAVATVENGVVTAVGAGEATITVTTTSESKTASCIVTVTEMVQLPELEGIYIGLDGTVQGLEDGKTYTAARFNALDEALGNPVALTASTVLDSGVWYVTDTEKAAYLFVPGAKLGHINFWDTDTNAAMTGIYIANNDNIIAGKWTYSTDGIFRAVTYYSASQEILFYASKAKFLQKLSGASNYINAAPIIGEDNKLQETVIRYGFTAEQVIPASVVTEWKPEGLDAIKAGGMVFNAKSTGGTYGFADMKGTFTFVVKVIGKTELERYTIDVDGTTTAFVAPAEMAESKGFLVGFEYAPYAKCPDDIFKGHSSDGGSDCYSYIDMYNGVNAVSVEIPKSPAPTGITAGDGVIAGLAEGKYYQAAPMVLNQAGTALEPGAFVDVNATTELGGFWVVRETNADKTVFSEATDMFYVYGDADKRAELFNLRADGNYVKVQSSVTDYFVPGTWTRNGYLQIGHWGKYGLGNTNGSDAGTTTEIRNLYNAFATLNSLEEGADRTEAEAQLLAAKTVIANNLNNLVSRYAFDAEEIIKTSEAVSFKFSVRQENIYIRFTTLRTKLAVYVSDEEGNITTYSKTFETPSASPSNYSSTISYTVNFDELITEEGYIVGMAIWSATDIQPEEITGISSTGQQRFITTVDPANYKIRRFAEEPTLEVTANATAGYDITITNGNKEFTYKYKAEGDSAWTTLAAGKTAFTVANPGTYTVEVSGETVIGTASANVVVEKLTPVIPTLEVSANDAESYLVTITNYHTAYTYEYSADGATWTAITDGKFVVDETDTYTVKAYGPVFEGEASANVVVEKLTPFAPSLGLSAASPNSFKVTICNYSPNYIYEYKPSTASDWTVLEGDSVTVGADLVTYTVRAGGVVWNGFAESNVTTELLEPTVPDIVTRPCDNGYVFTILNYSDTYAYEYKLDTDTNWTPVPVGKKAFVVQAPGYYTIRAGGQVWNGDISIVLTTYSFPTELEEVTVTNGKLENLVADVTYYYAPLTVDGIGTATTFTGVTEFELPKDGLWAFGVMSGGAPCDYRISYYCPNDIESYKEKMDLGRIKEYNSGYSALDIQSTTSWIPEVWTGASNATHYSFNNAYAMSSFGGDWVYGSDAKALAQAIASGDAVKEAELRQKLVDAAANGEFKYAYAPQEAVKISELLEFGFSVGKRMGSVNLGAVTANVTFYVVDSNGIVSEYVWSGESSSSSSKSIPIDVQSIEGIKDAEGWVIGIKINPWTNVKPENITVNGGSDNTMPLLTYIPQAYLVDGEPASLEVTDGDINWKYYSISGRLFVSGSGVIGDLPDELKEYKENFSRVIIEGDITGIGDGVFDGCSEVQSFDIPSSVTSIGKYAFMNCSSASFNFNGGVLSKIGAGAFYYCKGLEEIAIADSVTTIEDSTFYYCSSLEEITIPDSVTRIGNSAFYCCSSLQNIILPDALTEIGSSAFYYCSSLEEIIIPDSVATIGYGAFNYCKAIEEIRLPEALSNATSSMFMSCDALKKIYIPKDTIIMGALFYGCKNLSEVEIHPENTRYVIENGVIFNKDKTTLIHCLDTDATSYTIPDGVTTLDTYAFSYRDSFEEIIIPNSVTKIGNNAFYCCTALKEITIPDSVTEIGSSAFNYCTKLTSVTLPVGLKAISTSCFLQCTSLQEIVIPDSVVEIGSLAFGLSGIRSINISKYVTKLDGNPFAGCKSVSVTVDSENSNYVVVDGNIYTKDMKTLVAYMGEATSFIVPEGVEKIGSYAFYVSSITDITLPSTLKEIGDSAFYVCSRLKIIIIPEGVEKIGNSAFGYSPNLAIKLPDTLTEIGSNAFDRTKFYDNSENWEDDYLYYGNYLLDVKTTVMGTATVKDGTRIVAGGAFSGCDLLDNIILPDTLLTIGTSAFSGCTSLESIVIPSSVTSIAQQTFYNCKSLESVILPDGVTTIGIAAFYNCISLESIVIPDSVTSIGLSAFYGCTNLTVYGYSGTEAEKYALRNNINFVNINPEKAEFTISNGKAKPGETVKLTLSLKTSSKVNSIALSNLVYDSELLEFVGFGDYEAISDMSTFAVFDDEKEYILIGLNEDSVIDGIVCTLEFKVKESATDTVTTISATPLVKLNSTVINSLIDNSDVEIYTYVVGDIDGDEDVDLDDAVYLFGYSMLPEYYPTSYPATMDFTKDGTVDLQDALAIFKYSMLPDIYPLD